MKEKGLRGMKEIKGWSERDEREGVERNERGGQVDFFLNIMKRLENEKKEAVLEGELLPELRDEGAREGRLELVGTSFSPPLDLLLLHPPCLSPMKVKQPLMELPTIQGRAMKWMVFAKPPWRPPMQVETTTTNEMELQPTAERCDIFRNHHLLGAPHSATETSNAKPLPSHFVAMGKKSSLFVGYVQGRYKRVSFCSFSEICACKMVEIGVRFGYTDGPSEVSSKREKVAKCKRERAFEFGKKGIKKKHQLDDEAFKPLEEVHCDVQVGREMEETEGEVRVRERLSTARKTQEILYENASVAGKRVRIARSGLIIIIIIIVVVGSSFDYESNGEEKGEKQKRVQSVSRSWRFTSIIFGFGQTRVCLVL
ncbi:hypothetical protein V8G54_018101 [Vigna mungo]|uniref:Uncharacterized protein n=1 Tax=Vigna mungo TaxID=3915 RepID=A0AAQ3N7G8_VIGMU